MIKAQKADVYRLHKELHFKIVRIMELMKDASTSENPEDFKSVMLTFSGDEWDRIVITFEHYDLMMQTAPVRTNNEKIEEWFKANGALIAYMRDMVASWYHQLFGNVAEA